MSFLEPLQDSFIFYAKVNDFGSPSGIHWSPKRHPKSQNKSNNYVNKFFRRSEAARSAPDFSFHGLCIHFGSVVNGFCHEIWSRNCRSPKIANIYIYIHMCVCLGICCTYFVSFSNFPGTLFELIEMVRFTLMWNSVLRPFR